jgi:hypothetical protein
MLADLATATVIAAFIAPLLLIVVYSIAAPWHRSQIGRTLVTVKLAISLALLPPFVHRISGGPASVSSAFNIFQAATWGFLAIVLLRMSWVIIATQRKGGRRPS